MKIDFESTVLKIFKSVANTFSLAYDIAKANEEYMKPMTIYRYLSPRSNAYLSYTNRVLSIPLLSPSQDITWSLQVLSNFDEEVCVIICAG